MNGELAWGLIESARSSVHSRVDVARIEGTAAEIAATIRPGLRTALVLVESPRQPATAIARHNGLWGLTPTGRNPEQSTTWRLKEGREAGFAWIEPELLTAIIDYAAGNSTCFIGLAGPEEALALSTSDLEVAFDEIGETIDWGVVLAAAQQRAWTLMRVIRDEFGLEAQVFDSHDRLHQVLSIPYQT